MEAINRAIREAQERSGEIPIALPDLHKLQASETELNHRLILESERIGKFTCSEFHRLMTYEDKIDKLPAGAESYIMEKVSETLTGTCSFNDEWSTPDMDHGKAYELEAIEQFTAKTGIEASFTGSDQQFIPYTGDIELLREHIGGTPDGSIDEEVGIEVKCPKTHTHLSYILKSATEKPKKKDFTPSLKMVEKKYYWQVMGYMLLTGKKSWCFVSYDPRLLEKSRQLLILPVARDETDIQKLITRLEMAVRHKNEILETLKAA